jgi:hypothetical protein
MSALATTLCRSYSMHGVTVEVLADEPAVMSALDLRLCGFADTVNPADPSLRFEFVSTPGPPPPRGIGRPVYETPYGSLHYFPDYDLLTGDLGGVTLRCEPGQRRALISASAFQGRALYFATHPVATVALMELMERCDRFSLHAGCLADADGNGLVLSGPSGAGKSTLTLALAQAGMGFLGDDVLFLERPAAGASTLRVLGFADALGLGTFAASRFPEYASLAAQPPAEGFPKRLHRCEQLFGREPMLGCTPRVIVFPEVTAELPSEVTPIDRGEALLRLVPDVLLTHAESTQAHVAAIAELLGQVRCYTVRSGRDLEHAAEMIRALVHEDRTDQKV